MMQPKRTIVPTGCWLSDTFTHSVVNYVTGRRVFIGQASECEKLASTNHRLVCGQLRIPLITLAERGLIE